MAFIPIEKIKVLREAAKNGDARARQILTMQMNGEDFSALLDSYFTSQSAETPKQEPTANPSPVLEEDDGITDPKLKKFLEYNGVKKGDPDYETTVEAYYQEFPKARPAQQETVEEENDGDLSGVNLPNDDEDNFSIYGDDDEPINDNEPTIMQQSSTAMNQASQQAVPTEQPLVKCIDALIADEIEAVNGYNNAIMQVVNNDEISETVKKGLIADLEEIREDEMEHIEKLKRLKASLEKKEEPEIINSNEALE